MSRPANSSSFVISSSEHSSANADEFSVRHQRRDRLLRLGCLLLLFGLVSGGLCMVILFDGPPCPVKEGSLEYTYVGCYSMPPPQENVNDTTSTTFTLHECSKENMELACQEHCLSDFFGIIMMISTSPQAPVVDSQCICLEQEPDSMISFEDECHNVVNIKKETTSTQTTTMALYFRTPLEDNNCSTTIPNAWKDMVQNNDEFHWGWDVVHNTLKTGPLVGGICGWYNVTLLENPSATILGMPSLETTLTTVSEYTEARKSNLESTMVASPVERTDNNNIFAGTSDSASSNGGITALAMSQDPLLRAIFQSNGATSLNNSMVLESIGVKPCLEVALKVDLEGEDAPQQRYWVQFNEPFGQALVEYRNCQNHPEVEYCYPRAVARRIFDEYGQFVLEQGQLGGYLQYMATFVDSTGTLHTNTDEQLKIRDCFETYMVMMMSNDNSGGAGDVSELYGSGSFLHGEDCDLELFKPILTSQQEFATRLGISVVNGGHVEVVDKKDQAKSRTFIVDHPVLLPNRPHRFRLWTDLLHPSQISPIEKKRLSITNAEWSNLQSSLEQELLRYLDQETIHYEESCDSLCRSDDLPLSYLVSEQQGDEMGQVCHCFPCRVVCIELASWEGFNDPFAMLQQRTRGRHQRHLVDETSPSSFCGKVLKIASISAKWGAWGDFPTVLKQIQVVYQYLDGSYHTQVAGLEGGVDDVSRQVDFDGSNALEKVIVYEGTDNDVVFGLELHRSDGEIILLGVSTNGITREYQPPLLHISASDGSEKGTSASIKVLSLRNETTIVSGVGALYQLDLCFGASKGEDNSVVIVAEIRGIENYANRCWETSPSTHDLGMDARDDGAVEYQRFEFYPTTGEIKQEDLCVEYGRHYSDVYLTDCDGGRGQAWIYDINQGTFSTLQDDKCLDLAVDGNLKMGTYHGQPNQRFLVLPTSFRCPAYPGRYECDTWSCV